MTPYELLNLCNRKLQAVPATPVLHGLVLVHPRGSPRFPFSGKGTELLNATEDATVYWVPIPKILRYVAKCLDQEVHDGRV